VTFPVVPVLTARGVEDLLLVDERGRPSSTSPEQSAARGGPRPRSGRCGTVRLGVPASSIRRSREPPGSTSHAESRRRHHGNCRLHQGAPRAARRSQRVWRSRWSPSGRAPHPTFVMVPHLHLRRGPPGRFGGSLMSRQMTAAKEESRLTIARGTGPCIHLTFSDACEERRKRRGGA
jgi:hypothetical protein